MHKAWYGRSLDASLPDHHGLRQSLSVTHREETGAACEGQTQAGSLLRQVFSLRQLGEASQSEDREKSRGGVVLHVFAPARAALEGNQLAPQELPQQIAGVLLP